MGFIKTDTTKAARVGSIFIVKIGAIHVVGRITSNSKNEAIMSVLEEHIHNGKLPEVQLVKFKQTTETFADESTLHSFLCDYTTDSGYMLSKFDLDRIWGKIC